MFRSLRATLSLGSFAVLLSACGAEPVPAPQPVARHVVLITIDTLRADHVGVYGADFATPNLDAIANSGAVARHASAHVPLTRPSHVSLMTGLLPMETGIRENVSPAAIPEVPVLAELFRDAGFRTGGFVSSVVLSAASGLGRGFETYADDFAADPEDPGFLDTAQKPGDLTLAEALAWLEGVRKETPDERIFLWLHLYDPHDPYEPPEPWASQLMDRPYAGEVAWTDSLIGQLDAGLEGLGLSGDTLVAVTSDHGEGLGEHGEEAHGFFVYESTLRVPMILRGPGIAPGTTVETVVGLVDLFPTLLDLAGISQPADRRTGRSFAKALGGGGSFAPAPLYAESLVPELHYGWSALRVVRDGRYKYIDAPRPELYDLEADPGETADLTNSERRTMRRLQAALESFLQREAAPSAVTADAAAAQEALRRELAALGYVGGTPARTRDPGADPKDKIDLFRQTNRLTRDALEAQGRGDHEQAVHGFERIVEAGIESAEVHLYLGRSRLALGRNKEAILSFQATLDAVPSYVGAWLGLAEALLRLGDREAAENALARGRGALPAQASLAREHGRLLRQLGRPGDARSAFEAGLDADGDDAELHALMGEALRDTGDLEGASDHLRRAVALDPGRASFWNVLGMTRANAGDLGEAESAFREALRLDQRDPQHAFNLGLALLYQQRIDEARRLFQQAAELGFEPAREHLAQLGS